MANGGCSFGPKVLEQTHGRYQEAVIHVKEEQLLRNIVHLRYAEPPFSLEVADIAAQYELSAQAEARPFFIAPNPSNSNVFRTFTAILPDAFCEGANRPTLTFHPADDAQAVQSFFTPIPADTLMFLTQAGWPVSSVVRLWVERLNGVPNAAAGPPYQASPDFARFLRVTELAQLAQEREWASLTTEEQLTEVGGPLPAEAMTAAALVEAAKNGMEYRPRGDGKTWALVRKGRKLVVEVNPAEVGRPELAEFFSLLNLSPGAARYELVVSTTVVPDPLLHPTAPTAELRAQPRSTAQVWCFLSNGVEVPLEHLRCGLASQPQDPTGQPFDGRAITQGLFTVHACAGHRPPANAFVAVRYRDYWYYIDDHDQKSKETFALVLQISRLDFGRLQRGGGPVLTLPVGR
jgi:hypothetical protein